MVVGKIDVKCKDLIDIIQTNLIIFIMLPLPPEK